MHIRRAPFRQADPGPRDPPPALLRCELTAVGYREVGFVSLAPADGYLAVFVPPGELPPVESIRPCRHWPAPSASP